MEHQAVQAKTNEISEFGNYIAGIFAWMFAGLSVSGIIAFLIAQSGEAVKAIFLNPISLIVLIVLQFGLVIFLAARATKLSPNVARLAFIGYAATVGIMLSGIFLAYTSTSIMQVFFITGSMFLVMAMFGYLTKIDLTKFGAILLMGLVGVIIATIVNIFLRSDGIQTIVSYLGVVIFMGLTAYDVQKIKGIYKQFGDAGNMAILGALSLYLDFLNLFLFLLRIFGGK